MGETAVPESITVDADKCTGCMSCQLICSYTYTGRFNPLKAHISIILRDTYRIEYTDECTECGLCVEYCTYDALQSAGKEGP